MTPDELKALRAQLGLTQAELAARIGVTRNAVNLWEMGQRRISGPVALALRSLRKPAASTRRPLKTTPHGR
ncbi:helix-turn-helix domain-containing protein [Candidatus Nitrospira bockiana]